MAKYQWNNWSKMNLKKSIIKMNMQISNTKEKSKFSVTEKYEISNHRKTYKEWWQRKANKRLT